MVEAAVVDGVAVAWEIGKVVITSSTVIIGWMVVSDQQEARELSKSRYTRIYAMRDDLRKIEDAAITYHTSAFDQAKARSLIRSIKTFADELSHLKECGCIKFSTLQDVVSLRQAVTLKNCGSAATFEAQAVDSDFVMEIEAAVGTIDRQLLASAQSVATTPRTLRESVVSVLRRRI